MKKVLTIAALMLLLIGCGDGAITSPSTNALVDPDHAYEIDTWGSNSEIYEFTPRSNKNMTCIVFMPDSLSSSAMQCFKKHAS